MSQETEESRILLQHDEHDMTLNRWQEYWKEQGWKGTILTMKHNIRTSIYNDPFHNCALGKH